MKKLAGRNLVKTTRPANPASLAPLSRPRNSPSPRPCKSEATGDANHPEAEVQVSSLGLVKGKVVPVDLEEMERATFQRRDMVMLRRATLLAASSQGEVAPFPFSGCVLVSRRLKVLAETFQYASGTTPASLLATALASEDELKGSTLYMNLEPAYSLGEEAAVEAIVAAQAKRVVLGMEHPLVHLRGRAIEALRRAGVRVDCLRTHLAADLEALDAKDVLSHGDLGSPHLEYGGGDSLQMEMVRTLMSCLEVNENLLHYVAKVKPLCVLKYAMTLDGKTASVSGHSAWISGTQSRQLVYKQRALCDCVVVGGETVRSDNPNLTTRRGEGHVPTRVVVSRTLDLPTECNLWDTQIAPTLVITEKAKNRETQAKLRKQGVEVVELERMTLEGVVDHLYDRGFMRALWECGGALSGPAISEGVINKVMAFVAPKIIGGTDAPTPVGDALGLTKMTDALDVTDVRYEQVDQDVLAIGYLPSSRSLFHVQRECYALPVPLDSSLSASSLAPSSASSAADEEEFTSVRFYKAWNQYGLLSNFFCIPIEIDDRVWKSVEHYYQAMKFANSCSMEAEFVLDEVASQQSAEEAARIGRSYQSIQANLVRQDWDQAKIEVMRRALAVKFARGTPAWHLLRSTCAVDGDLPCKLIEYSPKDSFWGEGFDGKGENLLGIMLMEIRDEE